MPEWMRFFTLANLFLQQLNNMKEFAAVRAAAGERFIPDVNHRAGAILFRAAGTAMRIAGRKEEQFAGLDFLHSVDGKLLAAAVNAIKKLMYIMIMQGYPPESHPRLKGLNFIII